jgi:thioredoxin reductase
LKVAVVGQPKKSKVNSIPLIKNYPGFPEGIIGSELMKQILVQTKRNISDVFEEDVDSIESQNNFLITTESGKKLTALAIILAVGQDSALKLPAFGTPGVFLAGELAGTTTIAGAVGSGAQIAAEAVKYIRTIPSLKLT